MNSNDVSAAKTNFLRMDPKEDRRVAIRMMQYLLFYGCLIVCMSLIAFLLDVLFYRIDYGDSTSVYYSPLDYVLFFAIIGYWLFPLSLLYNYLVNKISLPVLPRMVCCVLLILFCFLLIRTNFKFGYYIGQYRQTKNILTAVFAGILIEWIRDEVVKGRVRKRLGKEKKQGLNS